MEIKYMKMKIVLSLIISFLASDIIVAQESLLIFRSQGKNFEEVVKGLSDELADEFSIKEEIISKNTSVDEVTKSIKSHSPKLVVLMDNKAISLFKQYQQKLKTGDPVIPSVSLMGVLIEKAVSNVKNATGISYEIPLVTSAVNLRSLLGTSVKSIGVVHRPFISDFLQRNSDFCKAEKIDLVTVSLAGVSKSKVERTLKKELKVLAKSKDVSAVWVPNDNALLNPTLLKEVWIPFVVKYKLPVIVGVEVLVQPRLNFGTFAVLPDHVALGNQAAQMIFDIMDNEWVVEDMPVQPPLSVFKVLNSAQATQVFNIDAKKLQSVDKLAK